LHFVVHRALEAGDSDTLRKYLPLLEGEAPVSLAITQTLLRARLELNEPDKARRTVRRYVERAGLDQNARRFIDRIASFEN